MARTKQYATLLSVPTTVEEAVTNLSIRYRIKNEHILKEVAYRINHVISTQLDNYDRRWSITKSDIINDLNSKYPGLSRYNREQLLWLYAQECGSKIITKELNNRTHLDNILTQ